MLFNDPISVESIHVQSSAMQTHLHSKLPMIWILFGRVSYYCYHYYWMSVTNSTEFTVLSRTSNQSNHSKTSLEKWNEFIIDHFIFSYISTFDCIDNDTCYLELLWTFASYHEHANSGGSCPQRMKWWFIPKQVLTSFEAALSFSIGAVFI